jgi:hypothetical protein
MISKKLTDKWHYNLSLQRNYLRNDLRNDLRRSNKLTVAIM